MKVCKSQRSTTQQAYVLIRSGHHANHWLSIIGEPKQVMPELLKYLNRAWGREIAEKTPGIDYLPNRLHLSLGKVVTGDLFMAKIFLGCAAYMYIVLSTAARAELHTAYPVIVSKTRKTYGFVVQALEWHNRIETVVNIRLEGTTDAESVAAVPSRPTNGMDAPSSSLSSKRDGGSIMDRNAASAFTSTIESNTTAPITYPISNTVTNGVCKMSIDESSSTNKDKDGGTVKESDSSKPQSLWSASDLVLPCFAVDFVSKREKWEGHGELELFLTGVASALVRNPQRSLPDDKDKEMRAWSLDEPGAKSEKKVFARSDEMIDDDDTEGSGTCNFRQK
jgi:hypothetical protein